MSSTEGVPKQDSTEQLPQELTIPLNAWRWRARVIAGPAVSEFFDKRAKISYTEYAGPDNTEPRRNEVRQMEYFQDVLHVTGDYSDFNRKAYISDTPEFVRRVRAIESYWPYNTKFYRYLQEYHPGDFKQDLIDILKRTASGDIYRIEHPNASARNLLPASRRERVAGLVTDVYDLHDQLQLIDFGDIKPYQTSEEI